MAENEIVTRQRALLRTDLSVVYEKIRLCREMMFDSPGIESDELLADLIGFLEAAKQRISALITIGSNANLGSEDAVLFEEVLRIYESVSATLEAEKVECII
jgi:hypothetical protein